MFGVETVELINKKKIALRCYEAEKYLEYLKKTFTQDSVVLRFAHDDCYEVDTTGFDKDIFREVVLKWFYENFDRNVFKVRFTDTKMGIYMAE